MLGTAEEAPTAGWLLKRAAVLGIADVCEGFTAGDAIALAAALTSAGDGIDEDIGGPVGW